MSSERSSLSDDTFDLMHNGPRGVEADAFRFKRIESKRWRRSQKGEEQTDIRLFIIGTTEAAARYVSVTGFLGPSPAPTGPVCIDGEWTTGFRFKELPDSSAASMIVDLDMALTRFEEHTDE